MLKGVQEHEVRALESPHAATPIAAAGPFHYWYLFLQSEGGGEGEGKRQAVPPRPGRDWEPPVTQNPVLIRSIRYLIPWNPAHIAPGRPIRMDIP